MTTDQDVRPRSPRQVGRRAVTRGAAWSIPVVSLAVAAPAMAASGCTMTTGTLSWDVYPAGSKQTGVALATAGGTGVTVTVTVSGDTGAAGNGLVTSDPTGGLSQVMRFYDLNDKLDTSQTVTLTFSQPVQNLSFSLLDIDSQGDNERTAYADLVTINTAGATSVKHENVKGSGTAASPFRSKNDSPVLGSSANGNVDLSWTGPVSSVSFTYAQNGKVDGSPFIGISDLSWQRCV